MPAELAGLRWVIAYKVAKACLQVLLALVALVLFSLGLSEHVHALALRWQAEVTHPWSLALAHWFLHVATPRHEHLLAFALGADGVLSAGEAFALQRGYRWSHWVVAALTASPLPFELVRLLRHASLLGSLLFAANALIVVYLLRHARVAGGRAATVGAG